MALKNYYTDKPFIPYVKTTVTMPEVVIYMQGLISELQSVLAAAYFMFRNESGNGKSGINNNYIGAQADSGRWPEKFDKMITGLVRKKENNGGDRYFLAFGSWHNSIDFLVERVQDRGLYYNGFERLVTKKKVSEQTTMEEAEKKGWLAANATEEDLKAVCVALAYLRSWVTGRATHMPDATKVKNIVSMYKQGLKIFGNKNISLIKP
jgi:hypothetical protein